MGEKAINRFVGLVLGAALIGGIATGLRTSNHNYQVYYGLMHAHTLISDGLGTPEEAFDMARTAGLDFFAVTPHNHIQADGKGVRRDGIVIASNHSLYNGTGQVNVTDDEGKNISLMPLVPASGAKTTDQFVAIYGQEFSTISSGNHMNVFGVDEVITVSNGNFRGLFDLVKSQADLGKPIPLVQMNHPGVYMDLFYKGSNSSDRKNMFNDYGIDEADFGPHFQPMIDEIDAYVHLIEVLSGPALKDKAPENFNYDPHQRDYFFYLKQGFHLSPSVGQDNHYRTWGAITDARMGVYANELTYDGLSEAIRAHRTFATEDSNLSVYFTLSDSDEKVFMGENLSTTLEEALVFEIFVADENESDAPYEIRLYGGTIASEDSREATNWVIRDGFLVKKKRIDEDHLIIDEITSSGQAEFFYIRVKQADGDEAWTAPVWANHPTPAFLAVEDEKEMFFWTKSSSSKVYHKDGCSSLKMIKAENLEKGIEPPEGRRLHECNITEEEED